MIIQNQVLIGNQAELFIAFLLSKYCLVRPVSSGTDIGIDLYCEIVNDNTPSTHFWVQVKSSVSDSITALKDKSVSYSFKSSHLKYWNFQPVPVFVFLIPDFNNLNPNNFSIYVIDICEYLLNNKIKNQKSQTIRTKNLIRSKLELENFLYNQVDITSARQKLNLGIIYPTPSSQNEYVKRLYPNGSARFADKILDTIRSSTSFILEELIQKENENPKDDNAFYKRKRFAKILQTFDDRQNWEVHYFLGLSYLQDKEYPKALNSFEKSQKIIQLDPRIDQMAWTPNKMMVQSKIDQVKSLINHT